MKNILLILTLMSAITACNITPWQVLQGLGSGMVDVDYIHQSKRLCAQQNDPALRFQCEKQAQKEFEKYKNEQQKVSNDQ